MSRSTRHDLAPQTEESGGWFWTNLFIYTPFKTLAVLATAATLTVGCGREGGMARTIDDNMPYDSLPAEAPRPTKPAEKLAVAARDLQRALDVQSRRDLTPKERKRADRLKSELAAPLRDLHRQFAADKAKLEGLRAQAALERLRKVDAKAARLERALTAALEGLPNGKRAPSAVGKAGKALAAIATPPAAQALSSNIGFADHDATSKPVSLSAGLTPAYSTPRATDVASDLPRAAQPEDLGETPETRVTSQVTALAQHLNRDPVKIFAWVRNKVHFEPYAGIRKGADTTLAERSGSDADQAALLIALLRASGIHARFVKGVAELPAATAANWLGVNVAAGESLGAVPAILSSAGFPTTEVRVNGILSKVRFEHVWAEAYVSSSAYRGIDEQIAAKKWSPLDPSIKENVLEQAKFDVKSVMAPSVQALGTSFVQKSQAAGDSGVLLPTSAALQPDIDRLVQDGKAAVDARSNISDPEDLLGGVRIKGMDLPYLPASTPFATRSVLGEWRAAPQSLIASVSFAVAGSDPLSAPTIDPEEPDASGFVYSARAADLAGRRVTVSYVPATPDDAVIIDAYHGLLNAPAYAASLIPVLRVDGQVVARGHQPVSTGYAQKFTITYRSPGFAPDVVENPVYVGSLSAVALAVGPTSPRQLKTRAEQLRSLSSTVTAQNVLTDARAGELLAVLGSYYFARNDAYNSFLARVGGISNARGLSGSIVATDVGVSYVAGFPVSTRFAGLTMDVDQDVQAVVAKVGGAAAEGRYLRAAGMNASASESAVFSTGLGGGAASTATIMQEAVERGVPFVPITRDNVGRIDQLVNVPAEVKTEISRAVTDRGATVTIPQHEITLGGWRGAGYIIDEGSNLQYRIYGGLNGGHYTPATAGEYDLLGAFVAAIKGDLSLLVDAVVWLSNTIIDGIGIFANCAIGVLDNIEQRQKFIELMMLFVAALSVNFEVVAGAIALSFVLPPIWPILAFAVLTLFLFSYYSQDGCLDAGGDGFE